MAEGDGVVYTEFVYQILNGEYDLNNADSIKVALFTVSYTPNRDTDTGYSGLSNECSGTGYTAGGNALDNCAVSKVTGDPYRGKFDADDETWPSLGPLTPAPKWAVMYDDTHASKLLIAYWDVGTTNPNGGDWKLQWGTDGILYIAA